MRQKTHERGAARLLEGPQHLLIYMGASTRINGSVTAFYVVDGETAAQTMSLENADAHATRTALKHILASTYPTITKVHLFTTP